jgi:hypothetical protein
MTSETKTTIEPGDILTIEIECTVCGARSVRLVGDYRSEPYGCVNCNARWGHLESEFKQLSQLVMMIRFFATRQATKDALPFRLRFEIAEQKRKVQP